MTAIRELPAQSPRVECGPVRFGDDWCGTFIRGDTSFYYAMHLRSLLDGKDEVLSRIILRGLLEMLESSDERTTTQATQEQQA